MLGPEERRGHHGDPLGAPVRVGHSRFSTLPFRDLVAVVSLVAGRSLPGPVVADPASKPQLDEVPGQRCGRSAERLHDHGHRDCSSAGAPGVAPDRREHSAAIADAPPAINH